VSPVMSVLSACYTTYDMVEEGDRVAVRWLFSGVRDGHPVVMPCVAIYRFVDGRVAEDWGIASYQGHPWP
jgi:ketosteroid isomerase-like protein